MDSFDMRWRWPPRQRRVLDMTPDGDFARPRQVPFTTRLLGAAILVAVIAGAVALASLALWIALTLIPIALAAALIAYVMLRWKLWRARRASFGGQRDVFRP
jgi:Flp pilus assembly protein TadB